MKKAAMSLMVLVTMFALVYASAITYETDKDGEDCGNPPKGGEIKYRVEEKWEKVNEPDGTVRIRLAIDCYPNGNQKCPTHVTWS